MLIYLYAGSFDTLFPAPDDFIRKVKYLNTVRVMKSKRLLKESEFSITQIAEKVGYENATHFGRVFKAITGLPPIKYRKNIT